MSLREFSQAVGVPYGVVVRRYRAGERDIERLMAKPDYRRQRWWLKKKLNNESIVSRGTVLA